MLKYIHLDTELANNPYPIFIADPQRQLYKLYHTEKSMLKLVNSLLFHGGFSDVNKGKKLFKAPIQDDGPVDLINAEFLINKEGKASVAHYGKHSGDFMPLEMIEKFASSNV
ncbi:MAG: hypothetical protein HC880_10205 [Bacteroidia bacterium]|nr:hypothetical protein [Bacteroidia bacterium]